VPPVRHSSVAAAAPPGRHSRPPSPVPGLDMDDEEETNNNGGRGDEQDKDDVGLDDLDDGY
jgi:hypothetical protein